MRRLIILLAFLVIYTAAAIAQTKTDRERQGLRGPVRSVQVEKAKASMTSGRLVEGPRVPVDVVMFDQTGSITQSNALNPDGSLREKLGWVYTYDAKGREVERHYLNADGVPGIKGVSTYDDKGRKVETTLYNPDGSINHIQAYFFDDTENKIRESHRNPDGSARNNIIRSYNAKGRLMDEAFYDGTGNFIHRSVFGYDEPGNRTGWTIHKADGTSVYMFRKSQVYDSKGNVIGAIHYQPDGSVASKETVSYEYDAHGNWIKRRTASEVHKKGTTQAESEVIYRKIAYF